MKCPNCGGTVQPGANRCVKCGTYVDPPVVQQQPQQPAVTQQPVGVPVSTEISDKSKVAAGILGIFFGWLGVHRLYLGYNAIGGVMLGLGIVGLILLIPTCGSILTCMWIWGLVEGIVILAGGINRDGQGRLLRN